VWWKLVKQLSYDQMAPVTELYLKFVIIITVFMFHYTEFPYSIMSICYSSICVCV